MKNLCVALLLAAVGAVGLSLASAPVFAAPVSSSQAELVAQHWLSGGSVHLGRSLGSSVSSVETFRDPSTGAALYHVIELRPKGYVVVAADDRVEPIVAFSASGIFDPSPTSPLVGLLSRDMAGRMQRAALLGAAPVRNLSKWGVLESGPVLRANTAATSETSLSDVWVAPLVQSQWNQGYPSSVECYNAFTPSNDYTGCVATALAQLMRYWQWPTTPIGTPSFTVYVNGTATTTKLRGGDGNGAAYDWSEMPLTPDTVSLTTAQYDEVGDISADAGAAVNMQYSASGSGAYLSSAQSALTSTFGYADAVLSSYYPSWTAMEQMIYPDLDAGQPVVLGISNSSEGHCVLADGYGEDSGTFYTHLNVGWGSSADATYDVWYNVADPDITSYDFNTIDQVIYNVDTQTSGETVSGMVQNSSGDFLPGVTVTLAGGGLDESVASSAQHGIYAFTGLASNTAYTISATYQGATQSITATTGQSSNYSACGNLWAQNIVFAPAVNNPSPSLSSISPTSAQAGGAQFTLTAAGGGFVSGSTVDWNGAALATTYVSATDLSATVPAADIASAGTASVTVVSPTPGGGTSSAASFGIDAYKVTASAGPGGSVSPSGTSTIDPGATADLAATPLPGFQVGAWTVDGAVAQNVGAVLILANVQSDHTVSVGFVAATLQSVTLSPMRIIGGGQTEATINLSGTAPPAGFVVKIESTDPAIASTPSATVIIPGGSSSVSVPITTYPVSSRSTALILANLNGVRKTADLIVRTPPVQSLTFMSGRVPSGSSTVGTVTLTQTSPVDTVVGLRTGNSSAIVPATVTVPAGQTSATFTVTASAVQTASYATITASAGGTSQSARVRLLP